MSLLPETSEPAVDRSQNVSLTKRLRDKRRLLGLTLKDVARGTGLSVGFISQIERGISTPSLSSLVAVSRVLDEPVGHFVSQPSGDKPITRQGVRSNFAIDGDTLTYERISAAFPGSVLNSVIIHEPPGHRVEPIAHEGEEMMFVLQGGISIDIAGDQTILFAGDSVHFPSKKPHSRWNHTSQQAILLWVGTLDVFGDNATRPADDQPLVIRRNYAYKP
jgi:transcriptional regulator with XRE-family HTH domain